MSYFSRASNVIVNGGTFTAQQVQVPKDGFERLQEYVVSGAFHDSGQRVDPPKCHPNTRLAILRKIQNWINGLDDYTRDALVMWLYGAAGAGKSAIAQSIAEILDSEKFVLATFFFWRSDPGRNTTKFLITTLAYHLATRLPQTFRSILAQAFDNDPLIVTRSLEAQFRTLIKEPLLELLNAGYTLKPITIVIDGLDECEDRQAQATLVDLLFTVLKNRDIPMKVLIASRPEMVISTSFDNKPSSLLARIALDSDHRSNEDIHLFLMDKFNQIKTQHPLRAHIPYSWPSGDLVRKLLERSSGQFIYASTIVKYVSSIRHRPTHRLEIVIGLRPALAGDSPFAELDTLYRHILINASSVDLVLKIIACILFWPDSIVVQFPLDFLENLFSLDTGEISLLFQDFGSLVSLEQPSKTRFGYPNVVLKILHASLKDFLVDQSRSKDLYLDASKMHTYFTRLCLSHINSGALLDGIQLENNANTYYMEGSSHQIGEYFFLLFHHCPRTRFSQDIAAEICKLSLNRCKEMVERHISTFNPYFLDQYFYFLKRAKDNWKDSTISDFVDNEVMNFRRLIMSQMSPKLPRLHLAFICASIMPSINQRTSFVPMPLNHDTKSTFSGKTLRSPTGMASLANYLDFMKDHYPALYEILFDAIKEGVSGYAEFHNPSDICSNAALFALRYATMRFYIQNKAYRRLIRHRYKTYTPVESKRLAKIARRLSKPHLKNDGFAEFIARHRKFHYDVETGPFGRSKTRKRKRWSRSTAFNYVIEMIPLLLEKSEYSEALISCVHHARFRRHPFHDCLPTVARDYRNKTIKKAVQEYLRRVNDKVEKRCIRV